MNRFSLALAVSLALAPISAFAAPVAGQDGVLAVDLGDALAAAPVGEFLEVEFTLTDAVGAPVTGANVTVAGGMAMHGHGLPTAPEVSELGAGRYVIKGLKFSMGGEWQLELSVSAGDLADVIGFEITL